MDGKTVVRADSLFETALGVLLAAGGASGWLDGGDFPTPVGSALVVVAGCALLAVGAVLWRLASGRVPDALLRNLAAANLATAALAIAWRLVADGFSAAGSALILATAGALIALAAAQLSAASPSRTA